MDFPNQTAFLCPINDLSLSLFLWTGSLERRRRPNERALKKAAPPRTRTALPRRNPKDDDAEDPRHHHHQPPWSSAWWRSVFPFGHELECSKASSLCFSSSFFSIGMSGRHLAVPEPAPDPLGGEQLQLHQDGSSQRPAVGGRRRALANDYARI